MKHKLYLTRARRFLGAPLAKWRIKRAVFAALAAERVFLPCEISVLLTDNEGIRALNREFRGLDEPTDVLSFPANVMTAGRFALEELEKNPKTGRVVLGDMALSLEKVRAQAKSFGQSGARELRYLSVHSALHLLGYDHVDEGDKRIMRGREQLIINNE